MQDRIRQQIAELEAEYVAYQVWHVPTVVPPSKWCARRWEEIGKLPVRSIVRDSVAELAEAITQDIDGRTPDEVPTDPGAGAGTSALLADLRRQHAAEADPAHGWLA